MSDSCPPRRSRLAEGPFCSIDECGCGTLHLSVGALTLRLEPEVAESIWNTIGHGLNRLAARKGREVPKHMEIFLRQTPRGVNRPS